MIVAMKFKTMIHMSIILSILSSCIAGPINAMSTSKFPVLLNLKRVSSNDTSAFRLPKGEVRTKPYFFEHVLGIQAGKPFSFDISKWKAIQQSGLFKNLTAKATSTKTGEVVLKITGDEMPSIKFSPEISVAASFDRPEVSGGVSFSDLNFRGLGQRLNFQITKKEGKEMGTDELLPTIVARWTDNKIGRVG